GTAALHPLHRSALLFPTPTSISLPTLHSMLHGEFSSCLILGGHSIAPETLGISPLALSPFAPSRSVKLTEIPRKAVAEPICSRPQHLALDVKAFLWPV